MACTSKEHTSQCFCGWVGTMCSDAAVKLSVISSRRRWQNPGSGGKGGRGFELGSMRPVVQLPLHTSNCDHASLEQRDN